MNIQIWGQTGWLPSRPSMLCARGVFFSVCPFSDIHAGWESRSCGWAATRRRPAEERRTGEGNTDVEIHKMLTELVVRRYRRGIGNAELQPQCQSTCRAVYNMMAGLFWRPASLPWSHVGLPSAAAAVAFFALSAVISSRGNLCIEGPRAVLCCGASIVRS